MLESKTRQSDTAIAACTPSWMLRGVASHVKRRVEAVKSNLLKYLRHLYQNLAVL